MNRNTLSTFCQTSLLFFFYKKYMAGAGNADTHARLGKVHPLLGCKPDHESDCNSPEEAAGDDCTCWRGEHYPGHSCECVCSTCLLWHTLYSDSSDGDDSDDLTDFMYYYDYYYPSPSDFDDPYDDYPYCFLCPNQTAKFWRCYSATCGACNGDWDTAYERGEGVSRLGQYLDGDVGMFASGRPWTKTGKKWKGRVRVEDPAWAHAKRFEMHTPRKKRRRDRKRAAKHAIRRRDYEFA